MSSRPSGASLKPLVFEARGHLAMSPEALWPLVADTARLNRAIGLPPVHYNGSPAKAGGVARAEYRFWGIPFVRWNEHLFEIDAPRRYAVRRVFHWGPIAAAYGGVELTRDVEGTDLRVFAELTPRYALGVPVARLIGSRLVERIYRQCRVFEQYNAGQRPTPFPQLSPGESANDRLQALAAELATVVPNAALVERIRLHLTAAPDEDVAHMRVYELADRWGFDRRETLIAFLHATTVGLTTMSWEVLCPNCRVSKAAYSSLRELREQAHCDVCNAVFDASFDRLVEVRFAVAPAIRQVEVHPFCLGGPMNAPHVVAQTRIEPGTTQVWSGWLTPGEYRLRTSPPVPIGANSWSPGGEGADLSPLPAVPEPGPTRGGGWRLPLSAPAPIRNDPLRNGGQGVR
ncbi:MAG: SRPBCC family protein, partial [Chloroflexi bacterium]|nr:SRPBCC family protein [Chloroflexota bacterium]